MRLRGVVAWGVVALTLLLVGVGTWTVITHVGRPTTTVTLSSTVIRATISQTDVDQKRGLGGVGDLPDGQGMLFVFAHDGPQAMWMKDMKIPLDIIWISETKKVTHIEHDLSPDTYPTIYTSPTPARYVLEVPAGTAADANIKIGMQAEFTLQ